MRSWQALQLKSANPRLTTVERRELENEMSTAQAVAVITGASRGIGAALVRAFRNRNYRVVATSRSIKPCRDENLVTVQGDVAAHRQTFRPKSIGVRLHLVSMHEPF